MYVRKYCMYVCMYVRTVCMFVCTVCMYVCMYQSTCVSDSSKCMYYFTMPAGGAMARRVGALVAMSIKDLQEKYNQFIIFYRTGKLAYVSSKIWDQVRQTARI